MIKDIVFVGWSTNKGRHYAEGFRQYIENHNYNFVVVVGGNDGIGASTLSVTDTVINQMNTCCGAIFLLPKVNPKKDELISGNVAFEYGYLQNRLRHHKRSPLIVKLDGFNDASLPTDLKNCWDLVPDTINIPKDSSLEDYLYYQIALKYLQRRELYIHSPFDAFTKTNEIISLIENFYTRRNILISEFATYLIYYLQTCYYTQDFNTLNDILSRVKDSESPNYLVYTKKYINICIDFYTKFFHNAKNKILSNECSTIVRNLKELNDNIDILPNNLEIKYLLKYFIHEHIGFASFVSIANTKDYVDQELVDEIIHHAHKSIEWINKHLQYRDFLKGEKEDIITIMDSPIESVKEEIFFNVLFASHCYGQLSNINYRLYETYGGNDYLLESAKYCTNTVKCRKYLKDNFYTELESYNAKAYETIRLDYYSALARQYSFMDEGYDKRERRKDILNFLNQKEQSFDSYEGFVDNIKKIVGFEEKHTFTIAVCGASGSGKSTLVNELYDKYTKMDKKCLKVIEDPTKNDHLGKNTFRSQLTFYTQNLDFLSNTFFNDYHLIFFDRSIDDHYSLSTYRKNLHEIDDKEFEVLTYLKDTIKKISPHIDLMIFLRCSFEETKRRFIIRHEKWDDKAEDYVESMANHYENWLIEMKEKNEYPIFEIDNTNGIDHETKQKLFDIIHQGMKKKNNLL